jgi:radical SAM superfamily enzyme YgiQ (UPF0313 family)
MKKKLRVVYILPTRYDDDGHVLRFWRGVLPSNTLCCLRSLTLALDGDPALGGAEVSVDIYDDTVQKVPVRKIQRMAEDPETQLLVGMVGVQSNQFPRALDLAVQFRETGIPVIVGGFHVSGVIALFGEPLGDLQKALDHGVSLVRGEAEVPGALAEILGDALTGELKPIYDIKGVPDISDAPVPQPDRDYLSRYVWKNMGTIDTSRGCPFNCSFCTIINVQGRTMRHRGAACILESIEANHERGVNFYFFTDDNFARSPVWEELLDGLAAMRAAGKNVSFMMQVDTQSYKIPGFIEKAAKAGCYQVFIGLETVNPANIAATGKRQNKAHEFAAMVEMWRNANILVHTGYIIGLPHDTPESVRRDIATLKDELKVDQASFFMLTPLPGSRDHLNMTRDKVRMDADLNNYDSFHETFRHAHIQPGEWQALYQEAWESFYSKENMTNILLRTPQPRYWKMFWLLLWNRYSALARTHPMVTGVGRLKERTARRPHYPREGRLAYAWRRVKDAAWGVKTYARIFFEAQEVWFLSRNPGDPRWAVLSDLRVKWANLRRRIHDSQVADQCQEAAEAARIMLTTASRQLHELSQAQSGLSYKLRHRLKVKAGEVDQYIRDIEWQRPAWEDIRNAERFARESLLAGYENMAIRYVAARRDFNAFWRRQYDQLRAGRWWRLDFLRMPQALTFEIVMGVRFGALGVRRFFTASPQQQD